MKKEIYKAAVRGDVEFLREARGIDVESATAVYNDDDLLALTSHGNNILHVAAQHGRFDFINKALAASFPANIAKQLICRTNINGDTPLHLAAKQTTKSVAKYVVESYYQLFQTDEMMMAPWRVQNKEGNTPLHVALMNGGTSVQVAAYLVEIGPEVASLTNQCKETPLHLAVHYDTKSAEVSTINMINTLNGQGAALATYKHSLFKEDSLSMIKMLLEINSTVCCLRDADGMTPLLKAASNSYLEAAKTILDFCPESVEMCDSKGRNILHHMNFETSLETTELLRKLEFTASLMNQQDEDGNTPMHVAVMNHNVAMVKAMIEKNANFAIKNFQGVSAASLIQSELHFFHDMMKNENNIKLTKDELMSKDLYEAAVKGNWECLTRRLEELDSEKLFLTRLPDGSNILHIVMENIPLDFNSDFTIKFFNEFCSKEQFIVESLKKFPVLACQTNRRGQTPLHLAMVRHILNPDGVLFFFLKDHFRQMKDQSSFFPLSSWKAKDVDGNTLLHLALKYGRFIFAECLINLDAELIGQTNKAKETPLHMLCQNVGKEECINIVDLILQQDVLQAYLHDADGFTPLLRAVHNNLLKTAKRILHHCPQSIRQYDYKGRNIFHWIKVDKDDDRIIEELCEVIPDIEVFMRSIDDEINTPLHLAIKNSEYGTAKVLMKRLGELKGSKVLLSYDMKTVPDILGEAQDIPRWFVGYLYSRVFELPYEFIWSNTKSRYGIRKTHIKEYMNLIGLISALLTTVTFTAAFAIPGGYNGENGTPILANKLAFRAFMFSDVIGMCSSMTVLFCVLWFQTAYHNDDQEELTLVDLTILLLQVSFYATLVAFMTGVYVTTVSYMPWFAISTCILCTTIFILMRKRFVLGIMLKVFFYVHFSIKHGVVSVMHFTKKIVFQ